MLHRRSLLLFISLLVLSACKPQQAAQTRNATQLDENFSSNQNGWDIEPTEFHQSKIDGGALTLTITTANKSSWLSPSILFPEDMDVQVEVMMPTIPTTPDWDFGIHVRASGRGNKSSYYTCGIGETGNWFISMHMTEDKVKSLKNGDTSTHFVPNKSNTLRCVIKGDLIKIYLDGKILGSVNDKTFPANGNPKYFHISAYNGKNGSNSLQAIFRNVKFRPAQ